MFKKLIERIKGVFKREKVWNDFCECYIYTSDYVNTKSRSKS